VVMSEPEAITSAVTSTTSEGFTASMWSPWASRCAPLVESAESSLAGQQANTTPADTPRRICR